MFEFSNQVLHYYEMQVSKGAKKYAISAGEAQPEAISFDIMAVSYTHLQYRESLLHQENSGYHDFRRSKDWF